MGATKHNLCAFRYHEVHILWRLKTPNLVNDEVISSSVFNSFRKCTVLLFNLYSQVILRNIRKWKIPPWTPVNYSRWSFPKFWAQPIFDECWVARPRCMRNARADFISNFPPWNTPFRPKFSCPKSITMTVLPRYFHNYIYSLVEIHIARVELDRAFQIVD